MGGLSGHICHLHEDRSLTFGEIKNILRGLADGTVENSEKYDGVNLFFTWDEHNSRLRVARNFSNIKSGGLDAEALAEKFADRGNLTLAFASAFDVLKKAIGSLDVAVRVFMFGLHARTWYPVEIIYKDNPNVIHYDVNCIVFHKGPIFDVESHEKVSRNESKDISQFVRNIDRMGAVANDVNWKLHGPRPLDLRKLGEGMFIDDAVSRISEAMATVDATDDDTIATYVFRHVSYQAQRDGIPLPANHDVTARIVGTDGAPTLAMIRKKVRPEAYAKVQRYVKKEGPELLSRAISPIELAIHEFAVEILRDVSSSLVSDPAAERARIRRELESSVEKEKASCDDVEKAAFRKHLSKVGPVADVCCVVEGIVFEHRGKTFKLTGNFAPINQILGVFRRKK